MKKFLAMFCVLSAPFFLAGCQNAVDSQIPKIDSNIESNVKIYSQETEYSFKVFHSPEGLTTVSFISPQNLKDFTISRNGGKFEVTQGGLQAEYMKDPLPQNAAVKYFMDVLDALSSEERNFNLKKQEEGEKTYKGTIENSECEVVLNNKGNIIRISAQNPAMEAEFEG